MGQKVNPIGIRLKINKTWDSVWFEKKQNFMFFFCVGGGATVTQGETHKNILKQITRVGFGRTEISARLYDSFCCALSFGHGRRGQGFQGVCKSLDFHDLGAKRDKVGNV